MRGVESRSGARSRHHPVPPVDSRPLTRPSPRGVGGRKNPGDSNRSRSALSTPETPPRRPRPTWKDHSAMTPESTLPALRPRRPAPVRLGARAGASPACRSTLPPPIRFWSFEEAVRSAFAGPASANPDPWVEVGDSDRSGPGCKGATTIGRSPASRRAPPDRPRLLRARPVARRNPALRHDPGDRPRPRGRPVRPEPTPRLRLAPPGPSVRLRLKSRSLMVRRASPSRCYFEGRRGGLPGLGLPLPEFGFVLRNGSIGRIGSVDENTSQRGTCRSLEPADNRPGRFQEAQAREAERRR